MTIDFQTQNLVKTVKTLTQAGLEAVEKVANINNPSWDEVFNPLDQAELNLGRALNVHSHLNSVMFDEKFNMQYEKTLPIITDYYHQISTNKKLYQAFSQLKNNALNSQQSYILENVIKDFELSGLNLTGQALEQFKEINERLSLLSNEFAKNSLQATNEWTKTITPKDLGSQYPKHLLDKLKTKTGYALNLQAPVYLDVMTYCDRAEIREELYRAYISRASELGITSATYDNKAIMDEILLLKNKKSKLLSFDNYAVLSVAKKMVNSPTEVVNFLEDLITKVKPKAQAELKELEDFTGKKLKPYDLAFYSEKLKSQRYGFSKSELLPYFSEQKVLAGLFGLIKRLYGVEFTLITEKTYHQDVKVFELNDEKGYIGKIYLDLYARKNKRSGAWMSDYQGLDNHNKPIAFVVCNLNTPSKDSPALFEFDEIVTIFHEFGHALHHLLTTTPYPNVAGINGVPWDGVELPSQMMENFCYEKSVVDSMSLHYQTGEKLPDDLYQKLIKSINFQSAMQLIRQCEFALWDMNTHLNNKDCYETLAMVQTKTALMPIIKENRFLNTFGHIFSGGYAAGYYSYLWAEVLSSDAYLHLKNNGLSQKVVNAFRDNILSVGGSCDFKMQYQKFRGKKPNIEALLTLRGL